MRIDKYLWCVRYYKTRNIATEACKKGHIRINGEVAKASKEVFPQDKVQIKKDQITYEIQVNDLPESRVGAKLVGLYCTDNTPNNKPKNITDKKAKADPPKKTAANLKNFSLGESLHK